MQPMQHTQLDPLLMEGPFRVDQLYQIRTSIPNSESTLLVACAIHLLNDAFSKARQNTIRNKYYNRLVANNLNNADLNKAVEMVYRKARFDCSRGCYYSVEAAIPPAVMEVTASLAAEFALQNPYLLQGMDTGYIQQLQGVYQNWQRVAPHYLNVNVSHLGGIQQAVPQAPIQTLNMQGIVHTSASPEWDDVPTKTLAPVDEPTPSELKVLETPTIPVEAKIEIYVPTPYKEVHYPSYLTTCKGKHEMDAIKHSRAYFGTVHYSVEQQLREFQGAAFAASKSSPKDREVITKKEVVISNSISEALDAVRVYHRRMMIEAKEPKYLSRIFAVTLDGTLTSPLVEKVYQDVLKGDVRSMGLRLKTMVDKKDDGTSFLSHEEHERLIAASYIDRTLGRLVNDFLARGLRLQASITTFSDSIVDCMTYIEKELPSDFNTLFQSFLNTLQTNFKAYLNEDVTPMMREIYLTDLQDVESEVGVLGLPIMHSVTYCNMTLEELEWTTSYKGTDIDPKVTPTLDHICYTLKRDKEVHGHATTYNWLLTGDGEQYLIYENPEIRGGWRIYPVTGLNINKLTDGI